LRRFAKICEDLRRFAKICARSIHFFLFFLATLVINSAQATSFPLPPRFSANALGSDYAVADVDLMLPLKGDNAHNLYVDPNLAYGSDNQGYGDLGVGYRWIHNEAAILGGYLFAGYSRIDNNARLWVANPGIEVLGSRWDAHVNGYAVMGDRNQSAGNYLGPIYYSGHAGFAIPYQHMQHTGNGADAEIAYQFFPQSSLKAYVGSYFFSPSQEHDIWGGAAGLEYWIESYLKVFASYTLDNVRHSTGALGLGVEFAGTHVHRSNPSLAERITDPVARYLSELGRGSAIPSRVNSQRQMMMISNSAGEEIPVPVPPVPIVRDIAFFSQSGLPNNGGIGLTLADCTFQNPCGPKDFSQTGVNTLNSLLPNTPMYFNGGSYPAVGMSPLTLNAGQSVHSRSADYTQAAEGDARSVFNGAFVLANNTTLDSIILLPAAGANTVGIQAGGAANFLVTGSQIGSASNPFGSGALLIGVSASSSAGSGSIVNSELFGRVTGVRIIAPNSNLTIQKESTITALGASNGSTGVYISNTTHDVIVTILENSQINVIGKSNTAFIAPGIFAQGQNTVVNMSQSGVNVNGNVSSGEAAYALLTTTGGTIQVQQGVLNVIGNKDSVISDSESGGGPIQISRDSTCSVNGSPPGPC
jgi:hypothetical protein